MSLHCLPDSFIGFYGQKSPPSLLQVLKKGAHGPATKQSRSRKGFSGSFLAILLLTLRTCGSLVDGNGERDGLAGGDEG